VLLNGLGVGETHWGGLPQMARGIALAAAPAAAEEILAGRVHGRLVVDVNA